MRAAALSALLLAACCAPRPPAVVTLEPFAAAPTPCSLPPVPAFPPIVGYPDARTIYVTIDDLAATEHALEEVAAWLGAARRCLAAPEPVPAPAPNR